MNIIKYKPFSRSTPLDKIFDDFFGTQLSDFVGAEFTISTPSANIIESAEGYNIELAVPGLSKDDVSIEVVDNTLIIKGSKSSDVAEDNFSRKEFNYSSFERKFYLGEEISNDKISAKQENGILTIHLVKDIKKNEKKEIVIE